MNAPKRDLNRDEVFVGGTELPQEWARDGAFIQYTILKAGGWWGRVFVFSLLAFMVALGFGAAEKAPWVPVALLVFQAVAFCVGFVRVWRSRRRV